MENTTINDTRLSPHLTLSSVAALCHSSELDGARCSKSLRGKQDQEGCIHQGAALLIRNLGITGSFLLIIFRSLISLCFITCLIRISFNLKKDQKNRPYVSCSIRTRFIGFQTRIITNLKNLWLSSTLNRKFVLPL